MRYSTGTFTKLTQEVGRDWSLQVDVFGTVLVVKLAAHKSMQVQVEWLDGPVEFVYILLKAFSLIPRAPISSCVSKS